METGLSCGRCETPICPKCAVFTDVGARCPDCAPQRKLPQFEISPGQAVIAVAVAAGVGAVVGAGWGLFFPNGFGFFSIFLGIGIGYLIAEPVSRSVRGKSGPVIQTAGAIGVVVAFLVHNLVAGNPLLELDFNSILIVIAGTATVVGRLRF